MRKIKRKRSTHKKEEHTLCGAHTDTRRLTHTHTYKSTPNGKLDCTHTYTHTHTHRCTH